jgi:hypothetical protein
MNCILSLIASWVIVCIFQPDQSVTKRLHFKGFCTYALKAFVKGLVEWLMRLSTFNAILVSVFLLRYDRHMAVQTFLVLLATVLLHIPKECARATAHLLRTIKKETSFSESRAIVY